MSRIVLKTAEEFQVSSVFMQAENQLCISFTGITNYDELRAKLTVQAMKEVKVYSTETDFLVYEDYTKFVDPSKIFKIADGTYEVLAVFEKEDEMSQRMRTAEENIQTLFDGFNFLMTEVIPSLMV
jgi:hypothetical protein